MHTGKYKAFLSYSHADEKWAIWLQESLEKFKIDRDLVGRHTKVGPIPQNLRPIFRDRSDLAAAPELQSALQAELDRSTCLIVICSPSAAKSRHVNDEIEWFQQSRDRPRVLPFIVDGLPGDPDLECFPAALKRRVNAHVGRGEPRTDPLAADARPEADGANAALVKLVSGMLGVQLDVLTRRRERRQTRERMVLLSALALLLILTIITGSTALLWRREVASREEVIATSLARASTLIDQSVRAAAEYGVPARVTGDILSQAGFMIEELNRLATPNRTIDAKRAEILTRAATNQGQLSQPHLQLKLSNDALGVIRLSEQRNGFDKGMTRLRAQAHLEKAEALRVLSRFNDAEASIKEGLAAVQRIKEEYSEGSILEAEDYVAEGQLLLAHSHIFQMRNDRKPALALAQASVKLGKSLAREIKNDAAWQQVARSQYIAADLIRQLNERSLDWQAQQYIEDGLKTAKEMVANDPSAFGRRRLEGELYLALGDFERWRARHAAALAAYREARDIRKILFDLDPASITARNEYGFSLIKLGEQAETLKIHDVAATELAQAKDIYDDLVLRKGDRINWMRWRWTARQGLARTYSSLGAPDKALALCDDLLRIARDNTHHPSVQQTDHANLMESYLICGNLLVKLERADEAIEKFDEAQKVAEKLPNLVENSYRFRRLTAASQEGKARVYLAQGRYNGALAAIGSASEYWKTDIERNKSDPEAEAGLAHALGLQAEIYDRFERHDRAAEHYDEAISKFRRIVRGREHHPSWPAQLRRLEARRAALQAKGGSPIATSALPHPDK